MGISINIIEAKNDLNTIKKQAEDIKSNYPAGTYMNESISKINYFTDVFAF